MHLEHQDNRIQKADLKFGGEKNTMKFYDLVELIRPHFGNSNPYITHFFDSINKRRYEKFEKQIRQKFVVQELVNSKVNVFTKANILKSSLGSNDQIFSSM